MSLSRRALLQGSSAAIQLLAANPYGQPEFWTLAEAVAALQRRKISSVELTGLCLARIKKFDGKLNSFITVREDAALAQARICDQSRFRSPLYGIPIALTVLAGWCLRLIRSTPWDLYAFVAATARHPAGLFLRQSSV